MCRVYLLSLSLSLKAIFDLNLHLGRHKTWSGAHVNQTPETFENPKQARKFRSEKATSRFTAKKQFSCIKDEHVLGRRRCRRRQRGGLGAPQLPCRFRQPFLLRSKGRRASHRTEQSPLMPLRPLRGADLRNILHYSPKSEPENVLS